MIPQQLEGASRRLGAPKGWDHSTRGICHTLEIMDVDGWMVSAWRPSAAELQRLNDGQPLFLFIQGTAHPVVALEIQKDSKPTLSAPQEFMRHLVNVAVDEASEGPTGSISNASCDAIIAKARETFKESA